MRAVLMANPKGGCGKTTLATNLAGCLANRGDSVLMWDLDRQKSSLEWLALRPPLLPPIQRLDDKDADAFFPIMFTNDRFEPGPATLTGGARLAATAPIHMTFTIGS